MTESDFNTMVLASRAPDVQALLALAPGSAARYTQALALANTGVTLDYDIDVLGQSAFVWTNYRISLGYKWIPNAIQTPSADTSVYSTLPAPAGSILVTDDPKAYPVYVAPGNPQPAPGVTWVDTAVTMADGITYRATPACIAQQGSADPIPNGMEYTENDPSGSPHIYHARYPVPTPANPGQRPLPGWIQWVRQLQ